MSCSPKVSDSRPRLSDIRGARRATKGTKKKKREGREDPEEEQRHSGIFFLTSVLNVGG